MALLRVAESVNYDERDVSDEALLVRIAMQDGLAFSKLVARHMGRVTGMAARLTGSRAEGEDVAQEAFARVWLNAGKWRPEAEGGARFTTWLYRVTVNLCIDRKRKARFDPLADDFDQADESAGALEGMTVAETARQVAAEIRSLPERQRTALVLCFYEGVSNADAASVMGLSVGAVESLLVRARRGLKEKLAHVYAELGPA